MHPDRRPRRAPPRCSTRSPRRQRQGRRERTSSRTRSARSTTIAKLAAWAHERGAILVVRRRPGGAAHARSTCRRSAPTSSRSRATRCAARAGIGFLWGRTRAPARDGAVPARRPHDPLGRRREDDAGASCRTSSRPARRRSPRPSASARRSTTSRRSGSRRSRRTSTSSPPTRSTRLAEIPGITLYGPPPSAAPGSSSFNVEGVHPHDVAQILDLDGSRDPRRPPLLPAADAQARRRRDEPRELLPLHDPRGDRPARRRRSQGSGSVIDMSEFDRPLSRGHPRPLQEPARATGCSSTPTPHAEGQNPLCGDEVSISIRFARGRRDDRGDRLRGPRLRDLAGRDVDADRARRRARTAAEVAALPKEELLDEIGIPLTPVRLKCAILGLGVAQGRAAQGEGDAAPRRMAGLDELELT